MGLIQRAIEAKGIPTISISLNRTITEKVKPPRPLFVGFPLGHPMGMPFDGNLQREVLKAALNQLAQMDKPGTIVDLTWAYQADGRRCEACTVELVEA